LTRIFVYKIDKAIFKLSEDRHKALTAAVAGAAVGKTEMLTT